MISGSVIDKNHQRKKCGENAKRIPLFHLVGILELLLQLYTLLYYFDISLDLWYSHDLSFEMPIPNQDAQNVEDLYGME